MWMFLGLPPALLMGTLLLQRLEGILLPGVEGAGELGAQEPMARQPVAEEPVLVQPEPLGIPTAPMTGLAV
jgi:hypothetical protein